MLFPWARAEVFCKTHDARMLSPQWVNVCRLGPLLRRERDKRYYLANFSNAGYVRGVHRQFVLHTGTHVGESDVSDGAMTNNEGRFVVDFTGMEGFFSPFLKEHAYVKERLNAIASPAILKQMEHFSAGPFVGVHIRRGDFQLGGISVDDAWYVRAIDQAVQFVGGAREAIPIRVFSDAEPETLKFLLDDFPQAMFMPKAPALLDMLLLSRCQALVGTSRSTFSMWAVFLGQMPSFWRSCDLQPPLYVSPQATVMEGDTMADKS